MKNFNVEQISGPGLRTNLRSVSEYAEDELQRIEFNSFHGPAHLVLGNRISSYVYPPLVVTAGHADVVRIPSRWIPGGRFEIKIWYSGSAASANNYLANVLMTGQRDGGLIAIDSNNIAFNALTIAPVTAANQIKTHTFYSINTLSPVDQITCMRFRRDIDTNATDFYLILIVAKYIDPSSELGA